MGTLGRRLSPSRSSGQVRWTFGWTLYFLAALLALLCFKYTTLYGRLTYRIDSSISSPGISLEEQQEQADAPGATPDPATTSIFPAGWEGGACVGEKAPTDGVTAAVVMVTFNRTDYLQEALDSLFEAHSSDPANAARFPLFLSQDGASEGVRTVAEPYLARGLRFMQRAELELPKPNSPKEEEAAHYRIANHYNFLLQTLFDCFGYPKVIIVEDNMQLAPDFFAYFAATAPLLDADPTLLCISAWNDHGQMHLVRDERRLYRTDFFPGLGWMLTAETWAGLRSGWPIAHWDDWLRQGRTRGDRQCICPEVCRTRTVGEVESSGGEFYESYLEPIQLSNASVPWETLDLGYLQPERYRADMEREVELAVEVRNVEEALASQGDCVLRYSSVEEYSRLADALGMIPDWRHAADTPRAAYRGIVTVRTRAGAKLFLAPEGRVSILGDRR